MALTEGIGTVGAGDSAYDAVKARAQQHLRPNASGDPAAQSAFEVSSLGHPTASSVLMCYPKH